MRWGGGERGPAQSNCGPSLTRRALAVASRAFCHHVRAYKERSGRPQGRPTAGPLQFAGPRAPAAPAACPPASGRRRKRVLGGGWCVLLPCRRLAADSLPPLPTPIWPKLTHSCCRTKTPAWIHWAAQRGDIPLLQACLAADPSLVHLEGAGGQLPLHYAASALQLQSVDALLDAGASAAALDYYDRTPAFRMACQGCASLSVAEQSAADAILAWLVEAGMDIGATDEDIPCALMEAARNGNAPLVRLLLKHGASADLEGIDGGDLLCCPVRSMDCRNAAEVLGMLRRLLKGGAPAAASSSTGSTPCWQRPRWHPACSPSTQLHCCSCCSSMERMPLQRMARCAGMAVVLLLCMLGRLPACLHIHTGPAVLRLLFPVCPSQPPGLLAVHPCLPHPCLPHPCPTRPPHASTIWLTPCHTRAATAVPWRLRCACCCRWQAARRR